MDGALLRLESFDGGATMSLMCPTRRCKAQVGMCLHEKIAAIVCLVIILTILIQRRTL